jgi:hypothetical protein
MSKNQTLWLKAKSGLRLGFETLLLCALVAPVLSDLITYIQATWAGEPYRAVFLGNLVAYILFFVLFFLCYIVPFLISGLSLSLMDARHIVIKIVTVVAMSIVGSIILFKIIAMGVGDVSNLFPFHLLILLLQTYLFLRPRRNMH